MLRFDLKGAIAFVLLAGLLIRALTPLGYMPAAEGSGLLFELCPDQMPAGFVLQSKDSSARHHHHTNSDEGQQSTEPDQCQVGHLLFSAMAAEQAVAKFIITRAESPRSFPPNQGASRRTASVYQPRAPPY